MTEERGEDKGGSGRSTEDDDGERGEEEEIVKLGVDQRTVGREDDGGG